MKIVIAPDSFKESLTALQASNAIEEGFKEAFQEREASFVKIPMADGGEGTVQSLIDATGGEMEMISVIGPLGTKVNAFYGLLGNGETAVIEMSSASGLQLVPIEKRNPLITTTWGTGELILSAIDKGINHLIIGIGGSATNDGGAGMIQALGGNLLNAKGEEINIGGGGLEELARIDLSGLDKRLRDIKIEVACDVDNPLTGPNGAAAIYGSQKGGTKEINKKLDDNLANFAEVIRRDLEKDIEYTTGAGAAGGLGAGLLAFLNAELKSGGRLIIDAVDLDKEVCNADLVITGEGGINHQTIHGKTPIRVAEVANKYGVPVIAFAGSLTDNYSTVYQNGIDAVFSIVPGIVSLEEALETGYVNLKNTARNVGRMLILNSNTVPASPLS